MGAQVVSYFSLASISELVLFDVLFFDRYWFLVTHHEPLTFLNPAQRVSLSIVKSSVEYRIQLSIIAHP